MTTLLATGVADATALTEMQLDGLLTGTDVYTGNRLRVVSYCTSYLHIVAILSNIRILPK